VDARHAFFPSATIWRSVSFRGSPGCSLPDANLHGKWSFRPLSRAGRTVTRDGFSGEASSPDIKRSSLTPIRPTWHRPACKVQQVGAFTWGRPPLDSEAFASGYGSCLLPLRLSYLLQSGEPVFRPPEAGGFVQLLPLFKTATGPTPRIDSSPFVFRVRVGIFWRGWLAGRISTCWLQ
jgi:hypothetical protein